MKLTVSIREDLYTIAKENARDKNSTLSSVVEDALEEYLLDYMDMKSANNRKHEDVLPFANLISELKEEKLL